MVNILKRFWYGFNYRSPEEPPPPRTSAQPPDPPRPSPAILKAPTRDLLQKPKPAPDGAILGEDVETHTPLVIPPKTRERHLYLIGKSGTGKTTLIKNLIVGDMRAGHGVGFIDPHGDAATELLETIPPHRIKDVIYFDPASEYAPAFNPLLLPYEPAKLREDILSSFKMFFGDSWGPRLEHLLGYGILTLITHGVPHSLKDLQTLFLKEEWRDQLTQNHPKQAIRDFWELEFPRQPSNAIDPILNKLSPLLIPDSPMERVFSQRHNDLDFTKILNEQKILIVNLSKGMIGEDPSRLLGGLITAGIQQAALSRASLPEKDRKDFHFYVDEFQNYTVSSFNSILAEARKYRLFLALAHQNLGQLPSDLQHNIFGNVATLVAFGVSSEDARKLQNEMHRTRASVRLPMNPQPISLDDFITSEKARLIAEKEETQRFANAAYNRWYNAHPSGDDEANDRQLRMIRENEKDMEEYSGQLQKIDQQLQVLEDPHLASSASVLHSVFPSYHFAEVDYPSTDEFINLRPHHAFARIERAENVTAFRTNPPPPAVAGIRGQILHAMRERHEQRAKERKAMKQPQGVTEPAPPIPTSREERKAAFRKKGVDLIHTWQAKGVEKPSDLPTNEYFGYLARKHAVENNFDIDVILSDPVTSRVSAEITARAVDLIKREVEDEPRPAQAGKPAPPPPRPQARPAPKPEAPPSPKVVILHPKPAPQEQARQASGQARPVAQAANPRQAPPSEREKEPDRTHLSSRAKKKPVPKPKSDLKF